MLDSLVDELLPVVGSLVESNYKCYTQLLEDWNVVVRSEGTISIGDVEGA